MAVKKDGLIFYKLESEYKNDYTKRCGIEGEEIDSNFYFLRGMDIADAGVSNDGIIYFDRLNGERISAHYDGGSFLDYTFQYDEDHGVMTILYPNGESKEIKGFLCKDSLKALALGTTDKLTGKGTWDDPLDIASVYLTGTYRPAKKFIDLTKGEEFDKLPENPSMGERYVTKEKVNSGGLYYTYDEILKIDEELKKGTLEEQKEFGWRVPTIEDWNNMLNELECPEDRNHGREDFCFRWAGKIAGKLVKTGVNPETGFDYWQKFEEKEPSTGTRNETGFSILPMGGVLGFDENIDGIKKTATLWSTSAESEGDERDIMAKRFDFNQNKVMQVSANPDSRYPLRLVKNYNNRNSFGRENILGSDVDTVLMKGSATIWTKTNVFLPSFTDMELQNKLYEEIFELFPEMPVETRHYVNEWDGEKWHKVQLKEGESVVLFESPIDPADKMHEWRIVDGKLIDTAQIIKDEFQKEFDAINGRIDDVDEKLDKEIQDRIDSTSNIDAAIEAERQERYKADMLEAETREKADFAEAAAREFADNAERTERVAAINSEAEARLAGDNAEAVARANAINAEAQTRQAADFAEAGAREYMDNHIKGLIEAEANRAKGEEKRIEDKLDSEVKRLDNRIDTEVGKVEGLEKKIDQEIQDRKDEISRVETEYKAADQKLAENDARIEKKFDDKIAEIEQSETGINEKLDKEIEDRKTGDNTLKELILLESSERQKKDKELSDGLALETNERTEQDNELQRQITENKLIDDEKDNSIVFDTKPEGTTVKVNLPAEELDKLGNPNHIKLADDGLYFDGSFGTF